MSESAPNAQLILTRADAAYRTTLGAQFVRALCKVAGVAVLARLVSPAEHGLFAMASSVVFLLVQFRDIGAGTAAIQARELTEEQKSTLFRLHVVGGVALMLFTIALAWPAARFFQEPRVAPLLCVMGASFILLGLNAWPRTLLTRHLHYSEINRIETIAAVLGTASMIGAAAVGAGAYSFVVFLLVSEATLVGAWMHCRWRPVAPARWESVREILRLGMQLTRANLIVAATQQVDAVLLGRWFGPAALGFYNRAGQILQQPTLHLATPFSQVLLATLSRLGPGSDDFSRQLRETANLIAYLTLPLAAVAFGAPEQVVHLVLGSGWPEAAPMLRWLAVGAAATYLGATATPVAIAANHARRLVYLNGALLLLLLLGFVIARPLGPVGLAAAYALVNAGLLLPRLACSVRGTPVHIKDYGNAFSGPLTLAVAISLGAWLGPFAMSDQPMPTQIVVAFSSAAIAGALCIAGIARVRREIARIWARRRSAAVPPP